MLINYYNPKDKEVCYFVEEGNFVITNLETGVTRPSFAYYPVSHMWNGGSPYIPVNFEVDSLDDLPKHPAIQDLNKVQEFQMMLDFIKFMRDPQLSVETRKECKERVLEMLSEIEKEVSEVKYED